MEPVTVGPKETGIGSHGHIRALPTNDARRQICGVLGVLWNPRHLPVVPMGRYFCTFCRRRVYTAKSGRDCDAPQCKLPTADLNSATSEGEHSTSSELPRNVGKKREPPMGEPRLVNRYLVIVDHFDATPRVHTTLIVDLEPFSEGVLTMHLFPKLLHLGRSVRCHHEVADMEDEHGPETSGVM